MASYVALAVVAGVIASVTIDRSLAEQLETQLDRRLTAQAHVVARWIAQTKHYDRLATRLATVVAARVTIVDASGVAIGDSEGAVDDPGAAAHAPVPSEIRTAHSGHVGRATRYSAERGQDMRYVAVPASSELAVRLGVPTAEIDSTKASLRGQLLAASSVSLLIAVVLAVIVARTLSRRLRQLSAVAEQIGRGNYDTPPPSRSPDEIGILSRTLHMTASQLRQIDAMRREFLSDVAHELRTPVTSIRGYAETLTASEMDDGTRTEFLQVIHRNALRIARLVDDLLQLQALEDSAIKREATAKVAAATIIDHVLATAGASAIADPDRPRFEVGVPPALCVLADPDGLEQILQNLVDNAVKYGGTGVTVRVSAARHGQRVAIAVADNGPGIAEAHLPRIFDRFYRADSGRSREQGGSGLGLAIAKKLAQSMNGHIDVQSEQGRGTTFTLELPAG